MLSLLWFVASESKSNYTIFSTSLIKKPSSLSAGGGGVEGGGLSFLLNFHKGGTWQDVSPQISGFQRVVAGKDKVDFLQGAAVFT